MRHYQRVLESIFLPTAFLILILSMSGVSVLESSKLSAELAVQFTAGTALWFAVGNFRPLKLPEAIGMGIALGTSITTFSQMIFRNTFLSDFTWAVPLLVLIVLVKTWKLQFVEKLFDFEFSFRTEDLFSIVLIFGFTTLAIASIWWWLYPFALGIFTVPIVACKFLKKQKPNLVIKSITSMMFFVSFLLSIKLQGVNDFWKVISNDQVFSESMSWSILKWGSYDSPFAAGTPINYHWFALLWSGATSAAVNAGPWIVMTRVVPLISYLGIFCLLWHLSHNYFRRLSAPIIACTFLVLYSNHLGLSFTRYTSSPTFLLSCVWLLAFTHTIFRYWENPSVRLLVSSSALLFMTFGGKIMNGAIGYSATVFALSIGFLIRQKRLSNRSILALAVASTASLICVYLSVYQNNQPGNLNYLLTESLLAVQLGLLTREKSSVFRLISNLFIVSLMMLPMIAMLLFTLKRVFRRDFRFWYVIGSIIAGLTLTFMTSHPGASQLYFWLASMVVTAILIPMIVYACIDPKQSFSSIVPYGLVCCAAAFVSIKIWNQSDLAQTGLDALKIKYAAVLSGFVIVSLLSALVHFGFNKRLNTKLCYFKILFLSIFVAFNLCVGLNLRFTNLISYSKVPASDPNNPNLITGSKNGLQILNWIRANTKESDIVATNRFCIPGESTCISKWQLVSAVSHRRMLFEGGYFELPSIPDQELFNRYALSSDFGTNPSPIGLRRMCEYGVKWYFFDHSVAQPLNTWEPYAAVQIQNEGVSLLRLKCPTN